MFRLYSGRVICVKNKLHNLVDYFNPKQQPQLQLNPDTTALIYNRGPNTPEAEDEKTMIVDFLFRNSLE